MPVSRKRNRYPAAGRSGGPCGETFPGNSIG